MFKDKNILVAGGTGLVGIPLTKMLIERGAEVSIASLDDKSRVFQGAKFFKLDLTHLSNCKTACLGIDYVFNLLCTKGSPATAKAKPASFLRPMLQFNTNLLEAARLAGVKRYLFASSVGVYPPAEVFYEDDVWKGSSSPNDIGGGWAKRMGELLAECYCREYGWEQISIVRPANIYGPYDNFENEHAGVFPALIKRVVEAEAKIEVWGDGSAERDFIFCEDVGLAMVQAMEAGLNPTQPINLGCGRGITIRELVETIVEVSGKKLDIIWDTSKPTGDKKRIMDISRAQQLIGFEPKTRLRDGIAKTLEWYLQNRSRPSGRYNIFD